MKTVVIYGFEGRYSGSHEYDYQHPNLGATHKCMLFLAQEGETPDFECAQSECAKYGFRDASFTKSGPLQVEALNTDQFRGFAGFYEEAVENGSALVYYPNA